MTFTPGDPTTGTTKATSASSLVGVLGVFVFVVRLHILRVVLDDADVFRDEHTRLLVNTRSGRFLRKKLPLLAGHRYRHVATTPGGFFVLADGDDYDAARILNPFTGHMIHFTATVPSDMVDAAAVIGSSPTLVLLCGGSDRKRYMAEPDSRSFALYHEEDSYPLIRLAAAGGMYADGEQRPMPPLPAAVADNIFDLMRVFSVDPSQMFWSDVVDDAPAPEIGHANNNRCYLVQSLGEVFIVYKVQLFETSLWITTTPWSCGS
ncbi:hypothetical protein D1007_06999 [Hordeum vulgare]|nr:hypothetical protein D1007_06999 [Hordeum vulgare]